MDLMIRSEILEPVQSGVLLSVTAEDLTVRAYVVIAAYDLSVVERLIPVSVFESGAQVHVGVVTMTEDVQDQVLQVLENMDPGDVVVYLCDEPVSYGSTLATLGATQAAPPA